MAPDENRVVARIRQRRAAGVRSVVLRGRPLVVPVKSGHKLGVALDGAFLHVPCARYHSSARLSRILEIEEMIVVASNSVDWVELEHSPKLCTRSSSARRPAGPRPGYMWRRVHAASRRSRFEQPRGSIPLR